MNGKASYEQPSPKRGGDKSAQVVEDILQETVVVIGMGLSQLLRVQFQKPSVAIPITAVVYGASIFAASRGYHLHLLVWLTPELLGTKFFAWLCRQSLSSHVYTVVGLLTAFIAIPLGFQLRFIRTKYQKIFESVGLTNKLGDSPVLVSQRNIDAKKIKLTFDARNIGITRFEAATADLEAAFGKSVEAIEHERSQKFVSLTLTQKKLPEYVTFEEISNKEKLKPYSFYVGRALEGVIQKDICELPHMIIAGTTGAGKSCFFKQALVGLLQSSPHLQMYLIDLKAGLEMIDFIEAPNVRILKTVSEALFILRKVKDEMNARFKFLEQKRLKSIDPKRDSKERIIVAVDEASILYMKRDKDDAESPDAAKARALTDEIAKLGRAAAIHLILATQKVTKETITTQIQENISARMCFKMNTLQGSLIVIGRKDASELSDIRGRGIWSLGNKLDEVQAPYITDVDIVERCSRIKAEFVKNVRKLHNPMIEPPRQQKSKSNDLENAADSKPIPTQDDEKAQSLNDQTSIASEAGEGQ